MATWCKLGFLSRVELCSDTEMPAHQGVLAVNPVSRDDQDDRDWMSSSDRGRFDRIWRTLDNIRRKYPPPEHKRAVEHLRSLAKPLPNTRFRNTSCERKLQALLIELNLKFITHAGIGPYEADVWIPSLKVVAEADGDYWHSLPGAKEKDALRDEYMAGRGIRVCRFTETELKTITSEEVARRIFDQ